ncbi:DUF748 domain-containing protein [Carboxylicivirga sediminis]|uniref:DUF748 domain-containing protein n=1 Tax=Carboxylicivirga sediminis TaxID=2006564 RepID=A0A941F2C4_9BACT|nr:DUF748 domain-containing protein [Carboxylicivirga sediminis]MBR8535014.1 DUF748 domain-containing protein [Carboxylicivirga sediminis]
MKQIKKRYYVLSSLALIIFLLLFFLSTFVKNYINKNSEELIGRKVHLTDLSINYFKVAVRASELAVYEANQTDTFAGFRELYVNFDPTRLFGNEYSFSTITLDSLYIHVTRTDKGFNFDDLIPPADSASQEVATDTVPSKPLRFAIHNIQLAHGHFNFLDQTVDNELKLEDITLELPLIAWDSESSDVGIEFEFGERGKVFVDAHVDQLKNEYRVDFEVSKLGLDNISSYVEDVIDAGGIEGYVNTKLHITGHMVETSQIVVKGEASVDSFRIWDLENKDVFRLDQFSVGLENIDVGNENYHFSHLSVVRPTLTASLYKDMTNIERMLLPVMPADSISQEADATADTTETASSLSYRVDNVNIDNGTVVFTDHTLYRPFLYDLKNINVELNGITNNAEQVPVNFSVNLNDQGKMEGHSTINILHPEVFDLEAKMEKLQLLSFSPYSEYHIARPITQGDFNYDLSISMTPTHMMNNNDIVINELEIGDKTQNEPQVKAPVKLGLYLMKDPQDVISIHMPVEGNPSDPNFSVGKLIWKAISNLIIKAAASPFNALGNLVGTRPEELENIPMPYAQDSLSMEQKQTLDKIASILTKKPQLNFSFMQQTDPETEKSALAVAMAKKRMLTEIMPTNNEKQIAAYNERLAALANDDPDFLDYISKTVEGSVGQPLSASCRQLIGEDELQDAFTKLLINRNEQLSYYLLQEKGVDSTSISVATADLRNLPEQLKSCNYKVEVSIK